MRGSTGLAVRPDRPGGGAVRPLDLDAIGLAVHPDFRGRHLADDAARAFQRHLLVDLDYHRLQLEIYGFNERAIKHAERSGFIREGVKRKAYWRHGEWVDGELFGLVREDIEGS